MSVISLSILVFAQQEQKPQQQRKLVAQDSSSTDPIITNQFSSTANSLSDVFARAEKSIVQITSTRPNPNQVVIINGITQTGRSTALGSGFVYDNHGYIVSNYHVIGCTNTADVTFTDGNTYSANVVRKVLTPI